MDSRGSELRYCTIAATGDSLDRQVGSELEWWARSGDVDHKNGGREAPVQLYTLLDD